MVLRPSFEEEKAADVGELKSFLDSSSNLNDPEREGFPSTKRRRRTWIWLLVLAGLLLSLLSCGALASTNLLVSGSAGSMFPSTAQDGLDDSQSTSTYPTDQLQEVLETIPSSVSQSYAEEVLPSLPSQSFSEVETVDELPKTILRTQPPIPADRLVGPGKTKYLAYLPHSGFHNARIELANGLLLALLTNRTLVVPNVRLGVAQAWDVKSKLERLLANSQKKDLVEQCRPLLQRIEGHDTNLPARCTKYAQYTEVSWPLLADLDAIPSQITLTPRLDLAVDYFTNPEPRGLALHPSSIHSFPDDSRYHWRIYDSQSDKQGLGKYAERLDIEDLNGPEYSEKDLLYFGSLFGSGRMRITKPEHLRIYRHIIEAFVFRNAKLDPISHEIARRMGGKGNYVSLHCRVGEGSFKKVRIQNMADTFAAFCKQAFGLQQSQIDALFLANKALRKPSRTSKKSKEPVVNNLHFDATDDMRLDDFEPVSLRKRQIATPSNYTHLAELSLAPSMSCRKPLYKDTNLLALNRPIYMATDSRNATSDPSLAAFFNTFPCIFLLSDFALSSDVVSDPIPALDELHSLTSLEDGLHVAKFLYPFLEAQVASRGEVVIGTAGSTFSKFASTTLHKVYMQESD